MRVDIKIEQILDDIFIGITDIEFFDCFSSVSFNINRNEVSYDEMFRLVTCLGTSDINFVGDASGSAGMFNISSGVIFIRNINIQDTLEYPVAIIKAIKDE